jgi:transposase-like protein
MVRAEREKLRPVIEVDEAYIGATEEGKQGRGAEKKSLLVLATELSVDEGKMGRIRIAVIPDAKGDSLRPFIVNNVEPGAKVLTDGWQGYSFLKASGFSHVVKEKKKEQDILPHVHLVISILKRWVIGTYQGGVQKKYLDFYLDEFVFRFNRRKSSSRGKLFRRLVELAVVTPPISRKDLKIKDL